MRPRLLLVEDIPELREWLRTLLAGRFPAWEIATAASAIDCRRRLERDRPALLLLDEVLGPGEDLSSLLQGIRSTGIPVVLMTGMDPATRGPVPLPEGVTRRMIKPEWQSGAGVEPFLAELGAVIALTKMSEIG